MSVLMAVRNRTASLQRTLLKWNAQQYPDWELLVLDDGSTEDIGGVVLQCAPAIPAKHIPMPVPKDHRDRPPHIAWNYGFTIATGKFVVVTNGDVIPSHNDLLWRMIANYQGVRLSVLTYFLTQAMQVDSVDWMNDPYAITRLPGFYDNNKAHFAAGLQTQCAGQFMDDWNWIGRFRPEETHVYSDADLVARETRALRRVDTLPGALGYHQWHPAPMCSADGPHYAYDAPFQARLLEPARLIK